MFDKALKTCDFYGKKVDKLGYLVSMALFFSSFMERFYGRILWKVIRPKQGNSMNILVFHPKHIHTQTHTHTHAQNKEKYFLLAFSIFLWQIMKHKFIMNLALILMKYGENLAKHLDWLLLHIIITILSFINS